MKNFVSIFLILFSLQAFAQEMSEDLSQPIIDEEQILAEENFQSDYNQSVPEEMSPGDIERQEDVLYPHGEENEWSLGSEELTSEEFE